MTTVVVDNSGTSKRRRIRSRVKVLGSMVDLDVYALAQKQAREEHCTVSAIGARLWVAYLKKQGTEISV